MKRLDRQRRDLGAYTITGTVANPGFSPQPGRTPRRRRSPFSTDDIRSINPLHHGREYASSTVGDAV